MKAFRFAMLTLAGLIIVLFVIGSAFALSTNPEIADLQKRVEELERRIQIMESGIRVTSGGITLESSSIVLRGSGSVSIEGGSIVSMKGGILSLNGGGAPILRSVDSIMVNCPPNGGTVRATVIPSVTNILAGK